MNLKVSKNNLITGLILVLLIFMSDSNIFYIIISLISVGIVFIEYNNKNFRRVFQKYFIYFFLPLIVIFIHALISVIVKQESFYLLRSISVFAVSMSEVIVGAYLYTHRNEKAINILFYACVVRYIYGIVIAIGSVGIYTFLKEIVNLGSDVLMPWLEESDIGLTMGMFVFYYLFFEKKQKGRKGRAAISILVFLLCYKRIAIAAVFAAIVYYLIAHKFKKYNKIFFLTCILLTSACLLYVYLIKQGILIRLFYQYGINPMGRDNLYRYFDKYYDFKLLFLGQGNGFTSKLLTIGARNGTGVGNIVALHSDILRAFIEYGFIGATIWYIYFSGYLPYKIGKKIGNEAALEFMTLTVYAYIIYLTDNTTLYFIFQLTYMLMPLMINKEKT